MAIYASRTRKTNSYLPDFRLISNPVEGDAFVYDPQIGAFVNKPVESGSNSGGNGGNGSPDPDLANYVTNGYNLSSNFQIFKQKNNQLLEFKGLVAGGGITLNNMGTDIRIANTVYETGRWQNDGIDIVFDNDGNLNFYRRGNKFSFEPTVSFISTSGDITIVANNPGQIISASQNFEALGFFAGQKIDIDGTDEQDGQYTIANVTSHTITLTTAFNSNLDAGLQPPVTIKGSRFQFINSLTFALYGIDLSQTELTVGDTIILSGTSANDGTYTVQSINGNQVEINEIFLSPFDYEFGNISIVTVEEDIPTGMSFDDTGNIVANMGTFQTIHTQELVADDITVNGQSLESYIEDLNTDLPSGGYLVGTDDGVITREIEVGSGLTITDPDGYDANTKISVNDFYLNFDGDVNGYAVISGLANTTISIDLDLVGSPGQYNLVTVDNKGRVVSGTKRVLTAGPGMTIVNGDMSIGDPVIHPNDFTITLAGDVQGQATVTDLGNVTIGTTLNLPNANMPTSQWFNRVQLNSMGWVTAVENQTMLASNGINIANADGVAGPPVFSLDDFSITFNGDVTGFVTISGLHDASLNLSLPDIIPVGTFNQVTVDTKGRVVSGTNVVYDFQASNSLLDELSNPSFNEGLMYWDATDYTTKTIIGTTDQITVNDTGPSIQISIPDNPIIGGYESITIPYGPTNFRPSVPHVGMLRINTDETVIEAYVNGAWYQFHSGVQDPSLSLQGGTMTGAINMSGNDLTNVDQINGYNVSDYFDLVDEINSGSGIKVSTPTGMVNRTLQATSDNGISITYPDGVDGNPTFSFSVFDFTTSVETPKLEDEVIFHDISENTTKKTTIEKAFSRPAKEYFMAQF
ncbi:MAG: hypothetical protein M0R77_19845 [Gammaproteobacteria bacterium]|nr:hypothetical protein [Gammaproteobacteria bacterium]